jgi:exportin-1
VLTQFQEHPDAWTRVDSILELSKSVNTKFYALGILESVIKYKWKALPREQCEGIKNYIVGLIIKMGSDEVSMQRDKVFLAKLNVCFVQVIISNLISSKIRRI